MTVFSGEKLEEFLDKTPTFEQDEKK